MHLIFGMHVADTIQQLKYKALYFRFRKIVSLLVHSEEQISEIHLAVLENQIDAVLVLPNYDFFESDDVWMILKLAEQLYLSN